MPSVTISSPTASTKQDLRLDFFVDAAAWEGQFDSLEVWRSRTTVDGPYELLTGAGWQPAVLPAGAPPPPNPSQTGPSVNLVGKTLELLVNEATPVVVTFTGSDPLTYAQAVTQIDAQGAPLVQAYVASGLLVLRTLHAGSLVSLRVTGGEAAGSLGLPTQDPTNFALGLDARIVLAHGVTEYHFLDHNGDSSFFYKTRFVNSLTATTSDFSAPFSAANISPIPPENLVRAVIDLMDSKGVALVDRLILLQPQFVGTIIAGKTVVDDPIQALTDANGHAEFVLVRGQPYTMAIAGTDIVRDFTTPTDPAVTSFSMLDPIISSNDVFDVQVPNLDYATRRSL